MGFKRICSVLSLFFLIPFCGITQNTNSKSNWTLKDPFEQKVFIENNEGQFDGKIGQTDNKIYFKTQVTGLELYFTSKGVTYKYEKAPKLTEEQKEELEKNRDSNDLPKPQDYFLSAVWKGSNPNVKIIPEDKVSLYYTYPLNTKHTIIAHAFRKLLYQNIYNNIDIEYSFPNEKKGIEYSVIVHPGADLSQVKLVYDNALSIKDSSGDIKIQSEFGEFIDHAPGKTWYRENGENLSSSFELDGNEIAFNTGNYDKSKTFIIDPWTTNPALTPYDAGYALRYDLAGNIYVYGGGNFSSYAGPFQMVKINPSGTILWYLYTSGWFGDIAVDEKTGISYVGVAQSVCKISSAGILLAQLDIQNSGPMYELWKMNFDACTNQIIIAGGGGAGNQQAAILDASFSSNSNNFNVLDTPDENHDMALLATDEANGYCYMATLNSLFGFPGYDNVLVKCSIPVLAPAIFMVQDGYRFDELGSIEYYDDLISYANGFNGMAVSPSWLYLYDGSNLKRFDKNTGSIVSGLGINTPVVARSGYNLSQWGGLDVDLCDNIYLGNKNEIDIYNSSFTKTGAIAMASTDDTIYDVRLGPGNMLYACGRGFVASFNVPSPSLSFTTTSSHACSGCNGTAFISSNGCGGNYLSYKWSNGETSQYLTGLCAGTYSVTVSYGCEVLFSDEVNISSSASPFVSIPTTNVTDVSCYDGNNGSATAIPSGGTAPYSYYWYPVNQPSKVAVNLTAGIYTVICTDSNDCAGIDTVTITQPNLLTLNTLPNVSIQAGENITLTASANGGTPAYTYTWDGNSNGSTYQVSPVVNTTYTVLVTDADGCTATAQVTVDVLCGELFVPDAFSPNGDRQNDLLFVRSNCIKTMHLQIFDRWGNKVFETENQNTPWDGRYNGMPLNAGTYVYYVTGTLYGNKTFEKKGNVTLVR